MNQQRHILARHHEDLRGSKGRNAPRKHDVDLRQGWQHARDLLLGHRLLPVATCLGHDLDLRVLGQGGHKRILNSLFGLIARKAAHVQRIALAAALSI